MTETVHAATPVATIRRPRAMHYARVDAVVALARAGQLYELHDATALEVTNALEVLGIRPPARCADLRAYAIELTDLADRIGRYELDPAGAYDDEHDTDTLAVPMARAGNDQLDRLRAELDELIGESHRPTSEARRNV